jgi:glycosyltransferase involved in cell wall biosynthesis
MHACVAIHVLGWKRWLDAPALWKARCLIRDGDYEVIHVWHLTALRVLALIAPGALPRVIVSSLPRDDELTGWDRRVLGRVRCATRANDGDVDDPADARCHAMPTAVATDHVGPPSWAAHYPLRIACAGRLERSGGFREAIWAIDILRYVFPGIHLFIAGTGLHRPELEQMIARLEIDNAHLLGDAIDPAELFAAADVCWVPSQATGDRHAALAAMAAGRAVVASDVPPLSTLIRDGETGCLVPPGEPVALARRTRALLQNPAWRERLGTAARQAVSERCAVDRVASRWQRLYNDLVA